MPLIFKPLGLEFGFFWFFVLFCFFNSVLVLFWFFFVVGVFLKQVLKV